MAGRVSILGSDGRPVKTVTSRIGSADGRHEIVLDHVAGGYCATGYHSRSIAVTEGRNYSQGSGDQHQRFDRYILIDESRGQYRDNPLYSSAIETVVLYVLGNGFALRSEPKVEQLWRDWWRTPDITNRYSGEEVAATVLREILLCGDHLIVKTDKGLIDLIEAERVAKGSRSGSGITTDNLGRPTAYHVCNYNKNGQLNTARSTPYTPDKVIFLAVPCRPSELRGMPPMQSTFPMLHRITDIWDSETIARQLQSRLALAIKKENAGQLGYTESKDDDEQSGAEDVGALTTRVTELKYAIIAHLEPGEDVVPIGREAPGAGFDQMMRLFLRLAGLSLGLPLELMLLDWTQSNYSQSRAVLQQAYERFHRWQTKLIDFFYDPLLRWKLEQWESQKLLGNKQARNIKWEWITPTPPWIDPQKEMEAVSLKLDRGLTTHGRECKSLGLDRNDVNDDREEEFRDAIKRAQAIQKDTGVDVGWQQFAGAGSGTKAPAPPTQGGASTQPAKSEDRDAAEDPADQDKEDEDA